MLRFTPSKPELMPPHVHRAFYNNGRRNARFMSTRINGFELFVDRESSTLMTTVWIMRSKLGSGVRIWKADIPGPFF